MQAGDLSVRRGAEIANQMRNEIMEMQRLRDFDLGRALARTMKAKGLTLDQAILKAIKKLKLDDVPFEQL